MASILVIDDDEVILEVVSAALAKASHTPVTAKEAFTAYDILQNEKMDLIIVDINLPSGISGFKLTEKIRETPGYENIPIMFMSGRNLDTDINKAISVGGDDYLLKPIDIDLLMAKVESLLKVKTPAFQFFPQKIMASGSLPIDLEISGISEQGMELHSPLPIPEGFKFRLESSLYEMIGVKSPLLRVTSCKNLQDTKNFLIRVNFIGFKEKENQKIRKWLAVNYIKNVKAKS